jgi:hypothetical protein
MPQDGPRRGARQGWAIYVVKGSSRHGAKPSFSYAVLSSSTIRVFALFQGCLAACTMRPYPTRVDVDVLRPLSWPTTLRPTAVRNATPCHNSSGFLASPYAS